MRERVFRKNQDLELLWVTENNITVRGEPTRICRGKLTYCSTTFHRGPYTISTRISHVSNYLVESSSFLVKKKI